MTIAFLFWLLMILWLIFGVVPWGPWPTGPAWWRPLGGGLLLWILLFLLGWHVFDWPIRG